MTNLIARAKVILTAAVTYIVIASTVLTVAAEEIGKVFTDGQAAQVLTIITRILAALAAAVSIIRRVTPVLPDERGILPGDTNIEPNG